MDSWANELGIPSGADAIRMGVRMIVATILGAVVGYERQRSGKSAGLRTHMLVSLSSALFVIAPIQAGMSLEQMSRIIQGLAAGIGFIGAGAILKVEQEHQIQGLTTAAGIWMTAAIGIAAGLGQIAVAAASAILTVVILAVLDRFER